MSDFIQFLSGRRSVKPKDMSGPGPSPEQIQSILTLASRVPDHGKYVPWYFIIFEGQSRSAVGEKLASLFASRHQDATPAQTEHEHTRFTRAPLVIGVISTIREGKNPQWEQVLSAGAACYNLCLAANAHGFATNWLSEWYAYDREFTSWLGIPEDDHVAGFIHIGTASDIPEDRDRPDLSRIVTYWQPGTPLQRGDGYGQPGAGLPEPGFQLKKIPNP